ncbi:MAG: flippase-like domain-containing protein [Caldilineales bacterium]|nr:flippase-like domain-containing protein [Caldilineales bacterium]
MKRLLPLDSKRALIWVGVLISIVSLAYAMRGLRLSEFLEVMRTANYIWILPGVAIYFFGVWARTWRWSYMLRPFKRVPLWRLFSIVCIGYAGNNIYPARAGEVIRSYVLKKTDDIAISSSLATVFVERVFDGLVMLLFVFLALPFTSAIPERYRDFVVLLSSLFGIALIFFIIVAARPEKARRIYDIVAVRLIPARFQPKLSDIVDRFILGFSCLRSGRGVLAIFLTSVVVWLAETMKYWFIMHAFDFEVSFLVLMLMNGIVNLFTTLPAAPGYIGTFDAPGIEILEVVGGVNRQVATAYTLVLHVALWLPITALGLWYFYRQRLHWSDFDRAGQAALSES